PSARIVPSNCCPNGARQTRWQRPATGAPNRYARPSNPKNNDPPDGRLFAPRTSEPPIGHFFFPLLTQESINRAKKGDGRLTGSALYQIVRRLGAAVGLKTGPHALRHSAITDALDLTGGDVRAVQRFSRHKDLRTLMIYDDRRTDVAGDVARKVADAVE